MGFKKLLFNIILSFLVFSWILTSFSTLANIHKSQVSTDATVTYNSHPSIIIDSDDDFGVTGYGFNGSGTIHDPYIIANYNFVSSSSYLIYVENVVVYFEIVNNTFDGVDLSFDAIYLNNVSNGKVCNNRFKNHGHAISLIRSTNILIQINHITSSNRGIYLYPQSSNNIIIDNLMLNNNHHGIFLESGSSFNILRGNIIDTIINGCGIYIEGASYNKIDNNTVCNTSSSNIHLGDCVNNTVSANYVRGNGIYISHSSYLKILSNVVRFTNVEPRIVDYNGAIEVYMSDYIYLFNNYVYNRPKIDCFWLWEANYNTLEYNTLYCNDDYGFNLYPPTSYNSIKYNNIFGTTDPEANSFASDKGSSNNFSMNYWEGYTDPDLNGDGFVDNNYYIDGDTGNFDPLPLTKPLLNPFHDLFFPTIIFPNGGEILNGSVTVQWSSSSDSWGHDISYEIYYYLNERWTKISDGINDSEILWDTTSLTDGTSYLIKVVASCTIGLTAEDCSDDPFTIDNIEKTTTTQATEEQTTLTTSLTTTQLEIISGFGILLLIETFLLLYFKKRYQKQR